MKFLKKIRTLLAMVLVAFALVGDTPQIQSSFELAFKYDLKATGTIKNSKGIPKAKAKKKRA